MRFRVTPTLLMGLALAAALALVLSLTTRLGQLRAEYRKVRQQAAYLHAGSYVPPVSAMSLAGDSIVLGETAAAGDRQVLLVFTTSCPYCRATLPVWAALADSLRKSDPHIQVVGVSLDSLDRARVYAAGHHLGFPIVAMPSRKLRILYRATAVPQTIVLDHDGQVRYAAVGTLREPAVLDSIYRAALDSAPRTAPLRVARRAP